MMRSSQGDSGSEAERMPWRLIPPFALSEFFQLVVACWFPGPSQSLLILATHARGQGRQFQSVFP